MKNGFKTTIKAWKYETWDLDRKSSKGICNTSTKHLEPTQSLPAAHTALSPPAPHNCLSHHKPIWTPIPSAYSTCSLLAPLFAVSIWGQSNSHSHLKPSCTLPGVHLQPTPSEANLELPHLRLFLEPTPPPAYLELGSPACPCASGCWSRCCCWRPCCTRSCHHWGLSPPPLPPVQTPWSHSAVTMRRMKACKRNQQTYLLTMASQVHILDWAL